MRTARKGLYILPNLLTVSSIFCSFLAITIVMNAETAIEIHRAALLIGLAMLFDMFDGRVARMTNTQSDFGVQLDSLADLASFGVAPAVIIYQFGLQDLGFVGVFAAFVYVACGAIRLARFNVQAAEDGGSSAHFQGLPIPAAAGVAMSVILVLTHLGHFTAAEGAIIPLAVMLTGLGGLMVSNVKYKTFKKIRVTPHEQLLLGTVVIAFTLLTVRFNGAIALAAVLLFYVGIGLIGALVGAGRRGIELRRARH